MKHSILTIASSCTFIFSYAQSSSEVKSKLAVKDTVKVQILSVLPDSFPTLNLTFKAQTKSGYPLWNLNANQIAVLENNDSCRVVSFKSLTKDQGVKIGLVIDHSGSMISDEGDIYSAYDIYMYGPQILARAPITKAKRAIRKFVNELNFTKDAVSVIGFSSEVDVRTDLLSSKEKVLHNVEGLMAGGRTAFYDATYAAVNGLVKEDGIKVIIALTDGDDNSSSTTINQLIAYAKESEIPVYTIGLGNVTTGNLKKIAEATQGEFFYARNSSELSAVYETVSKKINALYEIQYESSNLNSSDTIRNVYLNFNIDGLVTQQVAQSYDVPVAVREKLKAIEKAKEEEVVYTYAGAIAAFLIIGAGVFFLVARRKKKDDNLKYT